MLKENLIFQTRLPNLKTLRATNNNLTSLGKDFHNMPTLCQAHLSNNQITTVSYELVAKTQCKNLGVDGKLEVWLESKIPPSTDRQFTLLTKPLIVYR